MTKGTENTHRLTLFLLLILSAVAFLTVVHFDIHLDNYWTPNPQFQTVDFLTGDFFVVKQRDRASGVEEDRGRGEVWKETTAEEVEGDEKEDEIWNDLREFVEADDIDDGGHSTHSATESPTGGAVTSAAEEASTLPISEKSTHTDDVIHYSQPSRCSFSTRRRLMTSTCAGPEAANWKEIPQPRGTNIGRMTVVVDSVRRVLFCLQNKVAGRQVLSYIRGFNKPDLNGMNSIPRFYEHSHSEIEDKLANLTGFYMLQHMDPKEVIERYRNYTKVMTVRHPLQRFVSAYFELRHHFARSFRNASLEHFVNLAINGKWNIHFLPYKQMCRPCAMNYDYIIRTEMFDSDIPVLNAKLGLESSMKERHVNRQVAPTVVTTDEEFQSLQKAYKYDTLLREFERESPDDFRAVVKLYKLDSDMFGYQWTDNHSDCLVEGGVCC